MKVIELLKINQNAMELMSKIGLKPSDYRFINLYDEYLSMKGECMKYWYIITHLSEKYKISESSVKRLIRKFSREVIF